MIPASGIGRPATRSLYVGSFPDGSQLMVERWFDEGGEETAVTAAVRFSSDRSVVWGPPITLERER